MEQRVSVNNCKPTAVHDVYPRLGVIAQNAKSTKYGMFSFLRLWCIVACGVLVLVLLEFGCLRMLGYHYVPMSAIESEYLHDYSVASSGARSVQIIRRRPRASSKGAHFELELISPLKQRDTIQLPAGLIPHRVDLSVHGRLAVTTSSGDIHITPRETDPFDTNRRLNLRLLKRTGRTGMKNLAFSADGRFLAASSHASTNLWDLSRDTDYEIRLQSSAQFLCFCHDSHSYLETDIDGTLRVRSTITGAVQQEIPTGERSIVDAAVSPDSKYVLLGTSDYKVGMWSLEKASKLWHTSGTLRSKQSAAFSKDGTVSAICDAHVNEIIVRSSECGRRLASLPMGEKRLRGLFVSQRRTIHYLDTQGLSNIWSFATPEQHGSG